MNVLQARNLQSVSHGFFGRRGGVSKGIFASLNCGPGSNDERADVIENRRRVADALSPGAPLLTLYQIHGGNAVTVAAPWNIGEGPQADAMATNVPNIVLGILTADCAPVLFADAEAKVIGAAHAGWKGAISGVTDSTIEAMEALGAKRGRISAAIGPCISQTNYEVGPEFRERFLESDSTFAHFFIHSDTADHFRFDLEGFVAQRLGGAGIASVERLSTCTYAAESDFFSFRRATHRGEKDYGRQISAIVLK
ncbi:MAG TPA: peptidoglycan editing factor PgeF [Rhizomicrobium sp.]|nr:peptidoglycan editing factor PgeF [Rhizomicrobium sp.]